MYLNESSEKCHHLLDEYTPLTLCAIIPNH